MKNTIIISGFPGVGKSFLFNDIEGIEILDSDSSKFSWIEAGKRDPAFPTNYINHIKENMGKVDVILVSSHKIVRDELLREKIDYLLVYPARSTKLEYLIRYARRGSDDKFIYMMAEKWDEFLDELNKETFPKTLKLSKKQYLGDILTKKYCSLYGEFCSVKETAADEHPTPCAGCNSGKGEDYMINILDICTEMKMPFHKASLECGYGDCSRCRFR